MSSQTFNTIEEISARLDSTINFTLIRFVHQYFSTFLNEYEIIFSCFIAIVLLDVILKLFPDKTFVVIHEVVSAIGSAVLSQSIVNIATRKGELIATDNTTNMFFIEKFVVATSILILVTVLPPKFLQISYVSRCITLLLYMYTDAMQHILSNMAFGYSVVYVCVLSYVMLHTYHDWLVQHKTMQYLTKAFSMLTVNVLIVSITATDIGSVSNYSMKIQAILLTLALFIIDALAQIVPSFVDSRNYAIWKSAQKMYVLYMTIGIDLNVTIALAVIVLSTKSIWNRGSSTLFELILLVVINVALDSITDYFSSTNSPDKSVMLFMYVQIIHYVRKIVTAIAT